MVWRILALQVAVEGGNEFRRRAVVNHQKEVESARLRFFDTTIPPVAC